MNDLIDRFFADRRNNGLFYSEEHADHYARYHDRLREAFRLYFNDQALPSQRNIARRPIADTLVLGGHGTGKSTFIENWQSHPVLMPHAYKYYGRDFHDACEEIGTGGFDFNDLSRFFYWAGLSAAIDTSSASQINLRQLKDGIITNAPPLGTAHILLTTPEVAEERMEKRAQKGGHCYKMTTGLVMSHIIPRFAWLTIAEFTPLTCLWDCRQDGDIQLMATLETDATAKTCELGFYDDNALSGFNLSGVVMESMWRTKQEDSDNVHAFIEETAHESVFMGFHDGIDKQVTAPLEQPCDKVLKTIGEVRSSGKDFRLPGTIPDLNFQRAAIPSIPQALQPYQKLNPLKLPSPLRRVA